MIPGNPSRSGGRRPRVFPGFHLRAFLQILLVDRVFWFRHISPTATSLLQNSYGFSCESVHLLLGFRIYLSMPYAQDNPDFRFLLIYVSFLQTSFMQNSAKSVVPGSAIHRAFLRVVPIMFRDRSFVSFSWCNFNHVSFHGHCQCSLCQCI
jgi:hypothetical protein